MARAAHFGNLCSELRNLTIAAAHRHAGHLLTRPTDGPAAPPHPRPSRQQRGEAGPLLAACPTRGWPHGLHGRRDAFLIVATVALGLSHAGARNLTPTEITSGALPDDGYGGADGNTTVVVGGQTVPEDADPRECPVCAVVRWLEALGVLDGFGRGSARMDLTAAQAPLLDSPHQHRLGVPERWRGAALLRPAIGQHGWHDDYRPLTSRTRLARATARAALPGSRSQDPSPARRPVLTAKTDQHDCPVTGTSAVAAE